jgi:hypothetical protein
MRKLAAAWLPKGEGIKDMAPSSCALPRCLPACHHYAPTQRGGGASACAACAIAHCALMKSGVKAAIRRHQAKSRRKTWRRRDIDMLRRSRRKKYGHQQQQIGA